MKNPFERGSLLGQALFITPVVPDGSGIGVQKRAWQHLKGLSSCYSVKLIIIRSFPDGNVLPLHTPPEELLELCDSVDVIAATGQSVSVIRAYRNTKSEFIKLAIMSIYSKPFALALVDNAVIEQVLEIASQGSFSLVFGFRLKTIFVLKKLQKVLLSTGTKFILDLDDIESIANQRIAAIEKNVMGKFWYAKTLLESAKLEWIQRRHLSYMDSICVCSRLDEEWIKSKYKLVNTLTLPNGIDIDSIHPVKNEKINFSVLFVGALHYSPNEDAVKFLCDEILPELRSRFRGEVTITIVGRSPTPAVLKYEKIDCVSIHSDVPDLQPFYSSSDLVIVPLRAGGGTRIKILEAFAFQCPVVTTTIGAEGLEIEHDKHVLVADDVPAIVSACIRIFENGELRKNLVKNGYQLVCASYTYSAIWEKLRSHLVELDLSRGVE